MRFYRVGALIALSVLSVVSYASAQMTEAVATARVEEDASAGNGPIDYGAGHGVRGSGPRLTALAAEAALAAAVPGAREKGVFGTTVEWPMVMVHATLLPDGRVFMNGTKDEKPGQLIFDVWDPESGEHMVLPNTTTTDIFCTGQSVFVGSGKVLLAGGNTKRNGTPNIGIPRTTTFDPAGNILSPGPSMIYSRWYPSVVPLANGSKLIVGGRETPTIYSPTPELVTPNGTWYTLTGAKSDAAFGKTAFNWSYPRVYQMPNDAGKVFVLTYNGKMFFVNPTSNGGIGSITPLVKTTLASNPKLPTAMFAPGKLLSVRNNRQVIVVDINGAQPTITKTANMSQVRYYGSETVLADGKVVVTGGSSVGNQLSGLAYAAEIWDPKTGRWTLGASAARPRLYHSNALLLADGTLLTGGGGHPGPVTNYNAEVYYPGYLYDAGGNLAPRPTLSGTPATLAPAPGRTFQASVGNTDQISRVTLLRAGSATHDNNLEQRFQELPFTQAGHTLTITTPPNPRYTIPGDYLLFAFNQQGIPSKAAMLRVPG